MPDKGSFKPDGLHERLKTYEKKGISRVISEPEESCGIASL